MYGIREVLLHQERGDYSEHLSSGSYQLDCSMGSNPYGGPTLAFSEDVLADIAFYPESDDEIVGLIRQRFASVLDIDESMIAFSCGSIGTCMTLSRMLLEPGKTVVCMAPTFTAVTDDMVTYEVDFKRVPLRPERNFAFDADELVATVEANPGAYVYVDNPNNPTGQVYPLSDVRRVVEAACRAGSFITMDEAYGDYMDDAESALNLVPEFDNLAVVRTFAKGYGAAAARLGYCIAQPQIMRAFHMVNIPYSKSTLAEAVAIQALRADWARITRERVLAEKPRVMDAVRNCANLKLAHTDPGVSISMVYVDDECCDLEKTFLEAGVRVVTCSGYDGLGANAIRLNLCDDVDALVELIGRADKLV